MSPDCTAGRLADSSPATPAVHYGVLAVNKTDITRWCGFCSGLLVLSCSVTNMVGSQKFSLCLYGVETGCLADVFTISLTNSHRSCSKSC